MASWQTAVTRPLGLAGYALACTFGALAVFGPKAQYPWLAPVASGMAVLALLGGLLIALRQKPKGRSTHTPSVQQTTHGNQSPAVSDTKGPLNISYGGAPVGRKRS